MTDWFGNTPLNDAVDCGHTEIAQLLDDRGKNQDTDDNKVKRLTRRLSAAGKKEIVSLESSPEQLHSKKISQIKNETLPYRNEEVQIEMIVTKENSSPT